MARPNHQAFPSVRTEGLLLPPELITRVADLDPTLPGIRPEDYNLPKGERINEATNRAWNRLTALWARFRRDLENLGTGDAATGPTRDRWLLPLFEELGYGRLQRQPAAVIDGRSYAISHRWGHVPIHLVGAGLDLDRRASGRAGAAQASPHGLVQQFLNRSEEHLWAFLSNGLKLRILRDNLSLTRQAYVEFDLAAMLDGELYADFRLLWLLCHESRVENERPVQCWLERWAQEAREQGARALDHLREGVESAIAALGSGFLAHPANTALQARLASGELEVQDYYRQLMRLVYRLIFLFVAEDRDLLLRPDAGEDARQRYRDYYSTGRLRRMAGRLRGGRHDDLYEGLKVVMELLYDRGCPELALPALGSFLWEPGRLPDLGGARIGNRDLLEAIRALAFTRRDRVLRPVDYRNLGPEELGSVYESLLELHPELHRAAARFELRSAAGSERKTTGSYYTPAGLINELLDSALEPVLDRVVTGKKPEAAILRLKVCDPAVGSGHFLVAAAHRIARRLAGVRTGEEEPAPAEVRHALRDVVGHCLYGVDVNPMAVELCKVSLWMTAMEPGRPLSFLDHRVRCGNSLLGATPALMADGIPDAAFKPLTGDDPGYCRDYYRQNRQERKARSGFLFGYGGQPWGRGGGLAAGIQALDGIDDGTFEGVRDKQAHYESLVSGPSYRGGRLLADAWCAAFVWQKRRDPRLQHPITENVFRDIEQHPGHCPAWMGHEIERLAEAYGFFHWHLEFPDVFRPPAEGEEAEGWVGGFDVMLGNPPWERLKLQEKEWFAVRDPEIADAPNAAQRKRLIQNLRKANPALFAAYEESLRQAEGASALARNSGRFPLTGTGDVNTYALFAESYAQLTVEEGRAGFIVPTGIATDDSTKAFFNGMVESGRLVSLFDFENRNGIFPAVHRSYKFCLLTLGRAASAEFVFFALNPADLDDDRRRFSLSPDDFRLINPNTRTCPVFRSERDAELTKKIYRAVPVLINDGESQGDLWGITFLAMFHMAGDSGLFSTEPSKGFVPLYEAKMIHHFDHRWTTFEMDGSSRYVSEKEKENPNFTPIPRYWVNVSELHMRIGPKKWKYNWLIGWRNIARSTDERTFISTVLPFVGVGHSLPLYFVKAEPPCAAAFLANMSALVFDYVVRQKVGGTNMTYGYFKQFPVVSPHHYTDRDFSFIVPRVLELTYTAHDLKPWADDLGYDGPPFPWDPERRAVLRAELDAWYARLYGLTRDELRYILDPGEVMGEDYPTETFRGLKKNEVSAHGEYRTRRLVLDAWDRLVSGRPGRPGSGAPPGARP